MPNEAHHQHIYSKQKRIDLFGENKDKKIEEVSKTDILRDLQEQQREKTLHVLQMAVHGGDFDELPVTNRFVDDFIEEPKIVTGNPKSGEFGVRKGDETIIFLLEEKYVSQYVASELESMFANKQDILQKINDNLVNTMILNGRKVVLVDEEFFNKELPSELIRINDPSPDRIGYNLNQWRVGDLIFLPHNIHHYVERHLDGLSIENSKRGEEEGAVEFLQRAGGFPLGVEINLLNLDTFRQIRSFIRADFDNGKITKEKYRELSRELTLERQKQMGEQLFVITEEIFLETPNLTGDELYNATNNSFQEKGLRLSTTQKELLTTACHLLDRKKSMVTYNLMNIFKDNGIQFPSELKKEHKVINNMHYFLQYPDNVESIEEAVNSDDALKQDILHMLVKPENYNALSDEKKQRLLEAKGVEKFFYENTIEKEYLDAVFIDLSRFPAIALVINDEKWLQFNEQSAGFFSYRKGGLAKSGKELMEEMAVYVADMPDKDKILDHEWQHFLYYHFFTPTKDSFIAAQLGSIEDINTPRQREVEQLLGGRFNPYKWGQADMQTREVRLAMNENEDKTNRSAADQEFFFYMQDEMASYLERDNELNSNIFAYMGSSLKREIRGGFMEVSQESLQRFNDIHDRLLLYISSGVEPKELGRLIRSCSDFDNTLERLELRYPIQTLNLEKAMSNLKSLQFRDIKKIIHYCEENGVDQFFYDAINADNVDQLGHMVTTLDIFTLFKFSYDIHKISFHSTLQREENVFKIIEKIESKLKERVPLPTKALGKLEYLKIFCSLRVSFCKQLESLPFYAKISFRLLFMEEYENDIALGVKEGEILKKIEIAKYLLDSYGNITSFKESNMIMPHILQAASLNIENIADLSQVLKKETGDKKTLLSAAMSVYAEYRQQNGEKKAQQALSALLETEIRRIKLQNDIAHKMIDIESKGPVKNSTENILRFCIQLYKTLIDDYQIPAISSQMIVLELVPHLAQFDLNKLSKFDLSKSSTGQNQPSPDDIYEYLYRFFWTEEE